MSKVPKKLSVGEETFARDCWVELGIKQPKREFVFASPRKWRFDFAWEALKLAVEIEGGTWSQGRHTRGTGYEADIEKYNVAALMGWKVLRYSTAMVRSRIAIEQVKAALE